MADTRDKFISIDKAGKIYCEQDYNILPILPKGSKYPRHDKTEKVIRIETANGKSAAGLGLWNHWMHQKQDPNYVETFEGKLKDANLDLAGVIGIEEADKEKIGSLNIGIIHGNVSMKLVDSVDTNGRTCKRKTGSVVFECDGEGADLFMEAILISPLRYRLLNTPSVRTPSGGLHVYARYYIEKHMREEIKLQSQDFYQGEGHNEIKLLATGKYTIAPPSSGYIFEKSDFENIAILTLNEIRELADLIKRIDRRATSGPLWTDLEQAQEINNNEDMKYKLLHIAKILYEVATKYNRRHDTALHYSGILRRYMRLSKKDNHLIMDALDPSDRKIYDGVEDTYKKKVNEITSIVTFRKLLIELLGEDEAGEIIEELMLFRVPERQFGSNNPDGLLLKLAVDNTRECFIDQDRSAYALIHNRQLDSYQIVNLDSAEFDQMLSRWFVDEVRGSVLARKEHKNQAVVTLKSLISKPPRTLYDRCVWLQAENIVYYNLNNERGEVVKITANKSGKGIEIVKQNPDLLIFRKLPDKYKQITPSFDFDPNYDYLEQVLTGFKHQYQKFISKVWMISLLFNQPPYPIVGPTGPEGSGKTMLLKMIKSLVDPKEDTNAPAMQKRTESLLTELETDEKKTDDVNLTIYKNYFTVFDNVTKVPAKLMDILCRWVTGMNFSKRILFTTMETVELGGQRPLAITGIVNSIRNPDLISRIFNPEMELGEVDRKTEEELWSQFHNNKAKILGYMFHVVSKALANYDEMKETIKPGNRLADFTVLCEVISRCLGSEPEEFLTAWGRIGDEQVNIGLEYSTVAIILENFILHLYSTSFMEKTERRVEQSATEWYRDLRKKGLELGLIHNDNTDTFPKSPDALAKELYKLERSLKHIGIKVIRGDRTSTGRSIMIDFNNWDGDRGTNIKNETRAKDEPSGIVYECYYCKATPFKTGFKSEYESHHVRHHSGKPAYPNHPDIEILGLIPQGKLWEGDVMTDKDQKNDVKELK